MKSAGIVLGFVLLWLILDRSATMLGSVRGEWGLLVAVIVLVAAVAVEFAVSRTGAAASLRALGVTKLPSRRAMLVALAISAALLLVFPAYALATGTRLSLRDDWLLLLPGLLAQGGIAEETIFRGYLFRHFRERHAFWPAALWSAIPFVVVHLTLFLTLDPIVAAMSLIVALSLTFPLAWSFETAGNSIWPPAILHLIIQGTIKLVEAPSADFLQLALVWMVVSALAPWAVLLVRGPPRI